MSERGTWARKAVYPVRITGRAAVRIRQSLARLVWSLVLGLTLDFGLGSVRLASLRDNLEPRI